MRIRVLDARGVSGHSPSRTRFFLKALFFNNFRLLTSRGSSCAVSDSPHSAQILQPGTVHRRTLSEASRKSGVADQSPSARKNRALGNAPWYGFRNATCRQIVHRCLTLQQSGPIGQRGRLARARTTTFAANARTCREIQRPRTSSRPAQGASLRTPFPSARNSHMREGESCLHFAIRRNQRAQTVNRRHPAREGRAESGRL